MKRKQAICVCAFLIPFHSTKHSFNKNERVIHMLLSTFGYGWWVWIFALRFHDQVRKAPNGPLHFYRCCQFLAQFIFIRFCWGAALTQTAQTKLIFVKNLCKWILLFDWNFFSSTSFAHNVRHRSVWRQ